MLGVCPGDVLLRQCMEAFVIRDTKPEMNGIEEWGNSGQTNHRKSKKSVTSNKQINCNVK